MAGEKYEYTAEERARIRKYAAENRPARAVCHFSHLLGRTIPETTARRLKAEYLASVRSAKACPGPSSSISDATVTELPKMSAGRPLLLGKDLDSQVQAYITALRKAGGVVDTSVVIGAAEGIVSTKKPGLLVKHGGHIELSKSWVQSLFHRMGYIYVKRKGSNAGKVTIGHFEEVKQIFLADITAVAFMNDIPPQLILNWDQTAIQYVPTGQ